MLVSPPDSRGCLYLVGTPIGNLEDITLRALRILKQAHQIASEDTRHTHNLRAQRRSAKPVRSHRGHHGVAPAPELVGAMEGGGKHALVGDGVMPLVSGPGFRLVPLCARRQIPVLPLPGPSALLAALAASGLP